jgi:hypothetical protein
LATTRPVDLLDQPAAYAQGFDIFNTLSDVIEPLKEIVETNYDPYELGKLVYVLNRDAGGRLQLQV